MTQVKKQRLEKGRQQSGKLSDYSVAKLDDGQNGIDYLPSIGTHLSEIHDELTEIKNELKKFRAPEDGHRMD